MNRIRSIIGVCLLACVVMACSSDEKDRMVRSFITPPEEYSFEPCVEAGEKYSLEDFDVEYYTQRNGPGTSQRVMMVLPKNRVGKVPAVVVPFYFPEAMIGRDPRTGEELPRYAGVEIMALLARKGMASISAESYHLTYVDSDKDRDDFTRWQDAGEALLRDYPQWCGVGKLVADTRLLVDLLEDDSRIDGDRIGIAGHSLGGKMAFYAGCLDSRIKAILASDFGFLWEQSNWEKCWYWGDKLDVLKDNGIDNTFFLSLSQVKPIFLIAGEADDERSYDAMCRAKGYSSHPERIGFYNHATGHRPTAESLSWGLGLLNDALAVD